MIPKVSCYNQNFSAAGFPARVCASGRRTMSPQAERAAARVNHQHHEPLFSDTTCLGSLLGCAVGIVATALTKTPEFFGVWHTIGMGGGFVGGKAVELYRSTFR